MAAATMRRFSDQRCGGVDTECAPLGVLLVAAVGDSYRVGVAGQSTQAMVGGFVIGPQSRYGSSALVGVAEGVQVDLPWSSAVSVFGADLPDLADQAVALTALPGGARVVERLSETAAGGQVAVVGAWLHEQRLAHRAPSPLAVRALHRIEEGVCSVADLAAELGCSRGYLHRTVHAATGQPPRTLIRIARLHRMLGWRGPGSLADGAAAAGYSDHAHLCHEAHRFAGRTPRQLFGR